MKRIFIVAEIGCNHNGSYDLAKALVDKAKECGVDAVKFQTFKSEALISRYAPKAEYQKETTGTADSQLEMTKKLELKHEDFISLKQYAESLGLTVFSTPFDLGSIDFLYSQKQKLWKIPSGEITNLPYLEKIGSMDIEGKKIILSTGMATIEEIHAAVDVLNKNGTELSQITILHCNTEYPTPDEDINLLAIKKLQEEFPKNEIGFSDHSVGAVAATAAAMLGITLIEKHFTLDKNLPGPDHKASATPEELTEICTNIRRLEKMAGNGEKFVTKSEDKNKIVARKSIVASRKIKKGEIFTEENIICKRPGNGISPMKWYEVLGKAAEEDYEEDQLIRSSIFEWQEEK